MEKSVCLLPPQSYIVPLICNVSLEIQIVLAKCENRAENENEIRILTQLKVLISCLRSGEGHLIYEDAASM